MAMSPHSLRAGWYLNRGDVLGLLLLDFFQPPVMSIVLVGMGRSNFGMIDLAQSFLYGSSNYGGCRVTNKRFEAGKRTVAAITYRIELWSSILAAKGFSGSFRCWWREFGCLGDPEAPVALPSSPPGVDEALRIFLSFKSCFEACESWHLHQRLKQLKAKHDRTLHALFVDLKPPRKAQLDVLWQEQLYSVIGADSTTGQLHLDRPMVLTSARWFLFHRNLLARCWFSIKPSPSCLTSTVNFGTFGFPDGKILRPFPPNVGPEL